MSSEWGLATDAKGARISLLHDDTTSHSRSASSSQSGDRTSYSSRQQSAALPPISPLLNVSYPGVAQATIKRALNISTEPYYAMTTSTSSVSSPQATTPGFSEYHSAPTSQYSPRDTHSALDPGLSSSSYPNICDRPTFSRPGSFSLSRESVPRYPALATERLYSSQGQLGHSASPPSMSDKSYQSYLCRGVDLRRSESYGTTSTLSSGGSMDSDGPFTPHDEEASWTGLGARYRLSSASDSAYPSMLGKRSRDERDEYAGGYQYPPPPPGPEIEQRYDPYGQEGRAREYRPRASAAVYQYPPPPAPYREALSYAPPAVAPSFPAAQSARYSPAAAQPTRSSSLRQPVQPHPVPAPTNGSSTAPKKFPCRFSHTPPIFCQQTFTTSGHASRHAKIHKEEKGIACVFPGCGKRFTRGDNMKQHLETHFRVRGGRGKADRKKAEKGEDGVDRAEMQKLLREGAERRERERGEMEGRRRGGDGEMGMTVTVSPRSLKAPRGAYEMGDANQDGPYYAARPPMDALNALATVAVGRK